jgi:3-phosphoshikimate 1-carboxyvinyltransferase
MKARHSKTLGARSPKAFRAQIPSSKSYTHRALVLAALRPGTTRVENGLVCDDTERLAQALDGFAGLRVRRADGGFIVERSRARLGAPATECFLGGAGTPARLLMSFAAAQEGATLVSGNERLRERPMGGLIAALRHAGVRVEELGRPGCLPVRIHGGPISSRVWRVQGGVSSQFTSALLYLAAQQAQSVEIRIEGEQVSRPYVDMSLALFNEHGIRTERLGEDVIRVQPGVPASPAIRVEPDASGMSYFLAAAAISGTTVEIQGIGTRSAQGDVGFARALERMGCRVELEEQRIVVQGRELHGIDIDMRALPDVALTLAAVAAVAKGPTRITNLANLRLKECDRIHAAATELARLGATVEEGADFLVIQPGARLLPARIATYDDHRVAMAFAVLGLVSAGIEIEDPGCVTKSFPGFWDELERFRSHHAAG